jgi:hypothetical protein
MMNLMDRLRRGLRNRLRHRFIQPAVRASLLGMTSSIQHLAAIFPHKADDNAYTLPAYPGSEQQRSDSSLPVPPEPFWAEYCTTVETYLQSGLDDTTTMRRLLGESGALIENAGRILELGVAGGRLIRHLG